MSPRYTVMWNNNFSIDHAKIDDQHKVILSVVNDIINNYRASTVKSDLTFLQSLLKEHFLYEERLMRNIEYNNFNKHKEHHDFLNNRLNHILQESVDDSYQTLIKRFLIYFIQRHFMGFDRSLGIFIKNYEENFLD